VPDIDRFSLFTEARERLGRAFLAGVSDALPGIAAAIEAAADGAGSLADRRRLAEGSASLRAEAEPRARRALARLYDLTFRMLELNQSAPGEGEPPLLALMADDELDHQILADEVANAVREHLGAAYDRAMRRVDALTRTVSDDARAPLGATVLAAAALEALRPLTAERATRGATRAAAIPALAPRLASAIEVTDAWLAEQGVEPRSPEPEPQPEPQPGPPPSLPVAIGPSGDAKTSTAGDAPTGASTAVAATSISDALRDGTAPALVDNASPLTAPVAAVPAAAAPAAPIPAAPAAPVPAEAAAPVPAEAAEAVPAEGGATVPAETAALARTADALTRANEVAEVLGRQPVAPGRPEAAYRHASTLPKPDALEQDAVAFAHHVGIAPYTRDARQRFFDALRARMLAVDAAPGQLAALDLVAGLFDYVIDDTRMPDAAQPLLWRLQHPAVTLAALDAGYLGDDRRSVRRLVEHIAAISVAYADDVVQGSELYRRLETVVRAVEVVAHAFQSRSVVLGDQVRKEYTRAAQGVTQIVAKVAKERRALEATPGRRNRRDYSRRPSRDRELVVTRRLEDALHERLARHDVPDSVREFVLGVWLRHLRTAALRDGEDSSAYRLAMQVVDDLLWSLDESAPRPSRSQLASRIPPLIRLLTQGMSDSGAKPEEFRSFLDELFLIHLRKMQKVPRDGSTDTGTDAGPSMVATDASEQVGGADADAALDDGVLPTLDERLADEPVEPLDEGGAAPRAGAARASGARSVPTAASGPVRAPAPGSAPSPPSPAAFAAPGARPAEGVPTAPSTYDGGLGDDPDLGDDREAASRRIPADDRTRRAPSPGARLGWFRRSSDRPEPPRRGIQRLGPEDDDDHDDDGPVEPWPQRTAGTDPPRETASRAGHDVPPVGPSFGESVGGTPGPVEARPPSVGSAPEAAAAGAREDRSHDPLPGAAVSTQAGLPADDASLRGPAARWIDVPPEDPVRAAHDTPPNRGGAPRAASSPAPAPRSGDQRLLSVLGDLDLGDFPADPQRLRMDPDEALEQLERGAWLELVGRDGIPQEVKVAWINSRRTVVLLVRRPDRRAMSLRIDELRERFSQRRAAMIR
jgi:hypothetical protein